MIAYGSYEEVAPTVKECTEVENKERMPVLLKPRHGDEYNRKSQQTYMVSYRMSISCYVFKNLLDHMLI